MTTPMAYYLGVKTVPDSAAALDKLSFVKILDKRTLHMQVQNVDRINVAVVPLSGSDDLSQGLVICIEGMFTDGEMKEIEGLSELEAASLSAAVTKFVAKMMVARQKEGIFVTQRILGKAKK